MRVALFSDTFLPDVNGVARSLGRWVDFLVAKKIPVKVFAPTSEHSRMSHFSDRDQIERFFSFPFFLYPECRLGVPNPVQIKKSLLAFDPTIIHVATPFNMGLYGNHYAKKRGIPLVASYHTHFDQYLNYYRLQWMEGLLWRYMGWFHQDCRKIFVPSRSTLEHLSAKGFQQLEIWRRGVDTSLFHPRLNRTDTLCQLGLSPDKFTFLYVGRLAPEKSVDVILEAYLAMSEHVRASSQLVVTGDGPLLQELKDGYSHRHASIYFPGFVEGEELASLYAAADVFVFPSETETFGNVVLEAMASGTPVIGANAGGVRDNIKHLQTGWLCQAGSVTEFSRAMETLFSDHGLREKLRSHGLAFSHEQSWERIFERLLLSFEEAEEKQHMRSGYVRSI